MKANELIAQMLEADPDFLQGISERRAVGLVRAVFKRMNQDLAAAEEGTVRYAGLGQFRVKKVTRESESGQESVTRITFRLAAEGKRGGRAKAEDDADE